MARRKGSKNRSTLERELAAVGVKEDLSKLGYEELAAKATAEVPVVPPKPPEPVEKSIIDPERARAIIEATRKRFGIMVDYYTSDEDAGLTGEESFIPERIQEFLRLKVFMAASVDEAHDFARKALDKLHSHLLLLWSNKRISGPNTARNLAQRVAKMEKWANRLEGLGKKEEAERQRARARDMRLTPPTPSGTPWA